MPVGSDGSASLTTTFPNGLAAITASYAADSVWAPSTSATVSVLTSSYTVSAPVSFSGGPGLYPSGTPLLDSQGDLYGVTIFGGDTNQGMVFEVNRGSHNATTIASFDDDAGLSRRRTL